MALYIPIVPLLYWVSCFHLHNLPKYTSTQIIHLVFGSLCVQEILQFHTIYMFNTSIPYILCTISCIQFPCFIYTLCFIPISIVLFPHTLIFHSHLCNCFFFHMRFPFTESSTHKEWRKAKNRSDGYHHNNITYKSEIYEKISSVERDVEESWFAIF